MNEYCVFTWIEISPENPWNNQLKHLEELISHHRRAGWELERRHSNCMDRAREWEIEQEESAEYFVRHDEPNEDWHEDG